MDSPMRALLIVGVVSVLALYILGLSFVCSLADVPIDHSSEELEQLREASCRRVEERQQAVRQLIDGRCTLAEVLNQFLELDGRWPDYREKTPEVPNEGQREERSYRYVRAEVEEMLRDRPEEAAVVLRRLKHEYQQWRAGDPVPSAVRRERSDGATEPEARLPRDAGRDRPW